MRPSLRTLLLALPAALLAAFYYRHLTGVDDLWWHLRAGQWMWEHHAIPRVDSFSFLVGGEPWTNFEWLYQLFAYALFRLGDLPLVTLGHALLAALALLLMARAEPAATPRATALAVWIAAAGQFVYPWSRPHVFTQMGVALYLVLLRPDCRLRAARIGVLLALQALWVNLHGGYAIGLALLLGFAVERTRARREAARAWLLLGAALVVTLVNPYGWGLVTHGISELQSSYASTYIREWVSPLALRNDPAFYLVLGLFALLLITAHFAGGPQRLLWWVAVVVTGLLALRSVRFVSLFALAAVPFLADNFTTLAARLAPGWRDRLRRPLVPLLCLATAAGLWMTATGRLYALTGSDLHPGLGADPDGAPVEAVEFFTRHQLEGPLFHIYDDGSYLIWKLFPAERVLIDPRSALYGDARLHEIRAPLEDPRAFYRLAARHHFQAALIPHNAAAYRRLIVLLRQDPGWRIVHGDARSCLFIRADGPNAASAPAWRGLPPGPPAGYTVEAPSALPARHPFLDFFRQAPDPRDHRHYGLARLAESTGNSVQQLYHTREFLRLMPSYHWRYRPMQAWYAEQHEALGRPPGIP